MPRCCCLKSSSGLLGGVSQQHWGTGQGTEGRWQEPSGSRGLCATWHRPPLLQAPPHAAGAPAPPHAAGTPACYSEARGRARCMTTLACSQAHSRRNVFPRLPAPLPRHFCAVVPVP